MSSHQTSSDQVLSMVVEQAIYPITVDVMYSLFGPFGIEELVVYPPTISEDGQPCVAADVRFCSAHAAAYWDGRCIYFRCCRLQMRNATPDVLPSRTSPPTSTATPDAFMAGDIATSAHSTILDASVNIPTAASTSTPPHFQDTSPKSSLDSNGRVLVTGTTEYTLVAANPEVVTELAVLPGDPFSTTKAQEIPKFAHDATPLCISMVPVTCSTECSTQVDAIDSVDEAHDGATVAAEVHNTTTALGPELAIDLCNTTAAIGVATCGHHDKFDGLNIPVKAIISLPPHIQVTFPIFSTISNRRVVVAGTDEYALVEAIPDIAIELAVQPPTRHEGLPIRPTPWPSYLVHHSAEENEVRPTPWPSFSCSHEGMTLNHKSLLPQVTCVMKIPIGMPSEDAADSNFYVQLFRHVKQMGVLSTELSHNLGLRLRLFEPLLSSDPATITVHCLISMLPRDTTVLSHPIMQVMGDLNLGVVEWRLVICSMAAHLFQNMQIGPYELGCAAIVSPNCSKHSQWKVAWPLSSKRKTSAGRPCFMPWPSFACSPDGVTLKHTWMVPQVIYAMKSLSGNLNSLRAFSSYFPNLQLKSRFSQTNVHLKLPWPSDSCNCRAVQVCSELPKVEYFEHQFMGVCEHHVAVWDYAVLGCIPISDKLQGIIHLMHMSVRWIFLSQEEFKGSGRVSIDFHTNNAWERCSIFLGNCIRILPVQL
ncbi:hypothetical protein VPH35_117303 [Triticum aestivum]|uniref:PTBP1-like RNA recognition motif 2 domain-containing protein n=1 Tax=Triticum aestivum TaxID=4565 RepID=A0A3B6QF81_WHEAT|nr:uncharacterized protein LOC123144870 [Triticum aestivum]